MERAARNLLAFSFGLLAALVSPGGAPLITAVAAGGVVARGLLRGSQAVR